jgi:hypothetical protein
MLVITGRSVGWSTGQLISQEAGPTTAGGQSANIGTLTAASRVEDRSVGLRDAMAIAR